MAGMSAGIELPDIKVIRQFARELLSTLLDSVSGLKDLVLDSELMRPLDRIAGASLLREHGIDKIYKLEPGKTIPGCDRRIYMVRPSARLAKIVADQINAERTSTRDRIYKILFVPRKLHVCELILEREGVMGFTTLDEFPLDLIPLDSDILSLELPRFHHSVFLEGDQTWLHTVASSVINIQQTFGSIANVYCIGRCAKMVYDLTKLMTEMQPEPSHLKSLIGHLFLVDRDCDYVTPLCSQVTYEGLLDDTFGVRSGFVEFDSEVTGQDLKAKLLLTSEDTMFVDIRNEHFSKISTYLGTKAKDLQIGYDKRHNLSTVSAMKEFVANDLRELKQQHKSLSLHVSACEFINKTKIKMEFEDQLHTEHRKGFPLRQYAHFLLWWNCNGAVVNCYTGCRDCGFTLEGNATNVKYAGLLEGVDFKDCVSYIEDLINKQGGLPSATNKSLKTQFLQSFGFDKLHILDNLRRVGLFTESDQPQSARLPEKMALNVPIPVPFRPLSRKLNLIPKSAEDVDLRNPNDMSYVFSGAYTPLLCKIIEQVLVAEGFVGLDDLVRLIPLPTSCDCKAKSAKGKAPPVSSRVVLVYFIGGCTYTEIAALRFLGKQRGYKFIVATTSTGNNMSLIESCRS